MRVVGLFLAFALGLGGSAAGLRRVAALNPSASDGLLEHLAVHGGEYDLIIVGPSYVRLHFLPEIFDARMRQHGRSIRSFAFAMSEMRGAEIDYYLERMLALDLPKVKWVLCDVTLDQMRGFAETNWYKRRLIKWHEPEQFMKLPHTIMNREGTFLERASELTVHVEHLLLNLFNVGEGVTALNSFDALDAPIVRTRHEFQPRVPAEKSLKLTLRKYKKRRRHHLNFTKALIEARQQPPKQPQPNGIIVDFRNRIRARGMKPLFVLSPLLRDVRIETKIPGDEPLQMLDFNDPLLYPGLYNYKLRSNRTHFHYYGAEVYTLALADRFAAYLDGRQPAIPTPDPVIHTEPEADKDTEPEADKDTEPEADKDTEPELAGER